MAEATQVEHFDLPGMIQDDGGGAVRPPGTGAAPMAQPESPPAIKLEPVNVLPPTDRAVAASATREQQTDRPTAEKGGRLRRHWRKIQNQEVRPSEGPFLWYGKYPQAGCAGVCFLLFALFAGILLTVSVEEVVVKYSHRHMQQAWKLDKDLKGPVYVMYELPTMYLNHKSAVIGKDAFLWKSFLVNENNCRNAETTQDVYERRFGDELFLGMVNGSVYDVSLPTDFRPCGLVAIAMFTDEFRLFDGTGSSVTMDQTDLALKKDQDIYEKKILPIADKTANSPLPHYTIDGKPSWLRMGTQLEHFKVWYRTSCSPITRHLWARIPNGLKKGDYSLKFTVNSAQYKDRWHSDEKRIVFAELHTMGSGGACRVMGILCAIIAVCEAIAVIGFLAIPAAH